MRVRACVHACMRARALARAWVRGCVRVRACVCVRACVLQTRARTHARTRTRSLRRERQLAGAAVRQAKGPLRDSEGPSPRHAAARGTARTRLRSRPSSLQPSIAPPVSSPRCALARTRVDGTDSCETMRVRARARASRVGETAPLERPGKARRWDRMYTQNRNYAPARARTRPHAGARRRAQHAWAATCGLQSALGEGTATVT